MTAPLTIAQDYLARGWQPIPVPHRTKVPVLKGWQELRLTAADLPAHFNGRAVNVGILTGEPSHGLTDIDLDWLEAGAAASWFLPDTGSVFGRKGKRGSHRLYYSTPLPKYVKYEDPTNSDKEKRCIVEVRADGHQTVFPGSVHPSGEAIAWAQDGLPAHVDGNALRSQVARLAACCLLARHWPKGARQDAALYLAGGLLRAGWAADETERFISAVAVTAQDEEADKRPDVVTHTARKLAAGQDVAGWPHLAGLVGKAVVDTAREWLGIRRETERTGEFPQFPQFSPIDVSGIAVPPFPVHVLPPAPRKLVEAGSRALGAPPDMIAVPLLVFAGAAIGNTAALELKPGYVQRPTLYAGVVAPPGATKSPALDLARYPLDVLQQEALEQYRADLNAYGEAVAAAKQGGASPKPERPRMGHYFSTDSTTEASAQMLEQSPGFALVRDELVSWVKSFDAYRSGRGGDRQNWLSLWAGAPLKVDRKSADPIYVPNPVIGVAGGIQPDLLRDLTDEAGRRDGFIERILWAYPDVASEHWTDDSVDPTVKEAVVALFRRLRLWQGGAQTVHLDAQARDLWRDWYNENARLTAAAAGLVQGVYAKVPLQAARLALILHCLTHPDRSRDLDAETMAGALELTEYFRAHAHRVLMHFGVAAVVPSGGLAVRVLRVLEAANGEWVARDAILSKVSRNTPANEYDAALGDLEQQGLVEQRKVKPDGGGRPSEQWRKKDTKENIEEIEETPAAPSLPDRCPRLRATTGQSCNGPWHHLPGGAIQCAWCGQPPPFS
ncbi:MAG: DUF3987 domain-containing protein [Chloroflexi bacterium]|nr:DUF3987 domain-containing protein [Chloroflexota bacterium]